MAKEEQQSNQLNLTVVALVALVAIVGLVALVMNAASVKQLATGGQLASASSNTAGEAWSPIQSAYWDDWGSGGVNSQLRCCVGGKSIGQCARQGDEDCASNGGVCKAKCI